MTETALHLYLMDKICEFKKSYPEIKIKIRNNTTPEVIDDLNGGKTDIAFITNPFSVSEKLTSRKMTEFHEILVRLAAFMQNLQRAGRHSKSYVVIL